MPTTIESGPDEVLGPRLGEAGLGHPSHAVRGGVVEAAVRLDQHVEAHQEPEGVPGSVVVDDRLVDDQRAARRKRLVGLRDERPLLVQVPVVEHVAHRDHVGGRQVVGEEVRRAEAQAAPQAVLLDVLLEDRRHLGQVEAATGDVGVRQGDLHGEVPLGRTDVDEARVVTPGKELGDRVFAATAQARHRRQELPQARGVGVESLEEGHVARLRLVLEPPGAQPLGEPAPEPVEAVVRHLEEPAEVRGLAPVEEEVRGRRVVVDAVAALEEAQRDQRVEEIAGGALVQAEALAQGLEILRMARELREEPDLDRAEQRLRGPEAETDLHDVFRVRPIGHCSPRPTTTTRATPEGGAGRGPR